MIAWFVSVALLSASAAQPAASKPAPETPRLLRMAVRPTPAPTPALKYSLLPEVLDQTPGDAATFYLTAGQLIEVEDDARERFHEMYGVWIDAPLRDLPRDQVREMLEKFKWPLRQVELAAFRERCDWNLPIRSEGFSLLLPSISKVRTLAKLLAVRIRIEILDGDLDAAFHDLQTGLSMARHVADGPTIIQQLVGMAIADVMLDRTEELLTASNCPNLYWAFTQLPAPLISLRPGLHYERASLFFSYPQLRDPRNAKLSPQEWNQLSRDLMTFLQSVADSSAASDQRQIDEFLADLYPPAKRYLLARGDSPKQIDAMPHWQVIAIHQIDRYIYWRDEIFKWFNVPYWQAWEPIEKTAKTFDAATKGGADDGATLAAVLLPALLKAYAHAVHLDRRIAGLRCIEAANLYAAGHEGKLPASFVDITEVPIPIDPATGKPFQYKLDGDKAVLQWAPPPPLTQPKYGARYELTPAR